MPFQFSFPALGTVWWLEISGELSAEKSHSITEGVTFFVSQFEEKYSRFKPTSLVSTLNREGIIKSPDEETVSFLRLGQRLYTETDGLFNPLVGDHLIAHGYDADYSFKPTEEPSSFASPHTDLLISESEIVLKRGSLDMGGYGKGLALDLVANYLKEVHGVYDFLINAGGDIITSNQNRPPWEIFLEHPIKDKTYLGKIELSDCAFAASSPHKRRWKVGENTYTHIIDTTSSTQVNKPDASFVIAKEALQADVLGTVLLIAPPVQYGHLLESFDASAALIQLDTHTMKVLGNFPSILPL